MLELIAAFGPNTWLQAGSNGNWRQPPLPYSQDYDTKALHIGARFGSFEVTAINLGSAAVTLDAVEDRYYDPKARRVDPFATRVRLYAKQDSQAISITYAPRFEHGAFDVQPAIGPMLFAQQEKVYADDVLISDQSHARRIALTASVRVLMNSGPIKVGFGVEGAWYARYVDSTAGGDALRRPSYVRSFAELRY